MTKKILISAVAAAAITALAACAGTGSSDTVASSAAPSTSAQQTTPTQAGQAGVTDAEVQAYAAARAEIDPIQDRYASMTPQQRTQATQQITQIQQRHNLTPARYDAIRRAVQSDPALASRVTGAQGFSDAQIQAFAAASLEIDPINRSLATASGADRATAATQIREILTRNNLDGATYNAIATRAQTDTALQTRIAAARAPQTTEPPSGE